MPDTGNKSFDEGKKDKNSGNNKQGDKTKNKSKDLKLPPEEKGR